MRGGLQRRETVLIQAAAGGVRLAAVQLAARAGAKVIAVASGEKRRSSLLSLGADHNVNRTSRDVVDAVGQITSHVGADVVLDPVGTARQMRGSGRQGLRAVSWPFASWQWRLTEYSLPQSHQ